MARIEIQVMIVDKVFKMIVVAVVAVEVEEEMDIKIVVSNKEKMAISNEEVAVVVHAVCQK